MPNTDAYREAAARLLKCQPDDLLTFRWSQDEKQFIVIAPTGQKFRFSAAELEAAIAPQMDAIAPSPVGISTGEGRGGGQSEAAVPKSRKPKKSRTHAP